MANMDAGRTALLLMDFVNDIVKPDGKFGSMGLATQAAEKNVVANAQRALAAARATGMTVVHVRVGWRTGHPELNPNVPFFAGAIQGNALVEGTPDDEFYPPLTPAAGEVTIQKRGVSAFNGTELARYLALRGVQTLALAGIATNWVVESTARDAADLGYSLIILRDCCSSFSDDLHQFSMTNILSVLGAVMSAEEFAQALG